MTCARLLVQCHVGSEKTLRHLVGSPGAQVAEAENPIPGVGAAYRFGTAISGTPGDQSPRGTEAVSFMTVQQNSINADGLR